MITLERLSRWLTMITGQGDDYRTGCLLDYIYLKKIIS